MEMKEVHRFYLLHSQIGKLFGISPTLSDFSEGNIISATPSHKLIGKIHPTTSDKLIVPSSISATLSPKSEKMHEGDNPPVGILLCTRKGKKMVEYAIVGMDNNLFVSTYMLQLPDKATLEKFLLDEIEDIHEQDL